MVNIVKPIGGTFEDISDAVVKPISDEVGKAIEQGVQAVVGGPKQLTPQPADATRLSDEGKAMAGKQAMEQANLIEARRKIAWWRALDEAQKKVREAEKQKQMQRKQVVQQQQQQVKQFESTQKKKEDLNLQRAKAKTEIKAGVGG